MPLYNKKQPFIPNPNPPPETHATTPVFQLWPSGEIFTTYSDYLSTLYRQRQPLWSCSVTGKSNLTFSEAWESEQAARIDLQEMPEPWKRESAKCIQHSLMALNAVAGVLWEKVKNGTFLEGEEVIVQFNGERMPAKIDRIDVDDQQAGTNRYKLTLFSDQACSTVIGEGTVIGSTEITRPKHRVISKNLIKKYLRSVAFRDHPFSPWCVEENVAKFYDLPVELPSQLQALLNSKTAISLSENGKRQKLEGGVGEDALLFPMEDLLLPPISLPPPPEPTPVEAEYPVIGNTLFPIALHIWSFLNAFSKAISLSPFSFEDWMAALSAEKDSVMVEETVFALLDPVCRYRRSTSKREFKKWVSGSVSVMKYSASSISNDSEDVILGKKVSICVSKKSSKWYEVSSSTSWIGSVCGFLEEISSEDDAEGEGESSACGWDYLFNAFAAARKQKKFPPIPVFLFTLDMLIELYVKHQANIKEVVESEIERAIALREKLKLMDQEMTQVIEELEDLEASMLPASEPDSKERRKIEASIRRARQGIFTIEKKREGVERDLRKAEGCHRAELLGQDRQHRTFWWLDGWRAVGAAHHACGKLWIEDMHTWFFYSQPEQIDQLLSSLDDRGLRESKLKLSLVNSREHLIACLVPVDSAESKAEAESLKKKGGVRKTEPGFMKYRNKF